MLKTEVVTIHITIVILILFLLRSLFRPSPITPYLQLQNDTFSVKFPNAAPTYYTVTLTSPNIRMTIYAPADSNTIHPVTLIDKSKKQVVTGCFSQQSCGKGF